MKLKFDPQSFTYCALGISLLCSCATDESRFLEYTDAVRCDAMQSLRQSHDLAGPEDITIDHREGIAYVSATDRWEKKSGGLFVYRPGHPRSLHRIRPADDTVRSADSYFPHGISLFIKPCINDDCSQGDVVNKRLFVIHHPLSQSGVRQSDVEILSLDKDGLQLITAIEGQSAEPILGRNPDLNDLVAVDLNRFFATDNGAGPIASGLFGKGAVVYFDGKSWHEVITGLTYPNGIAYHETSRTLYVGTSNGLLRVFDASDPLDLVEYPEKAIDLDIALDNIEWENDNGDALLIAGHKSVVRFIWHSYQLSDTSPSSIWRVGLDDHGLPDHSRTTILHQEHSKLLPAISVAAAYQDRILLGSVFADRFLDCEFSVGDGD